MNEVNQIEKRGPEKISELTGLPIELIVATQKSISKLGIKHSEYIFLDGGIIASVYNEMKDAVTNSKSINECNQKFSEILDNHSSLLPLELFIKKNEFQKMLEEQEVSIDDLLRETRARIPHYEVTVTAESLILVAIILKVLPNNFLSIISSHLSYLIHERTLRKDFNKSMRDLMGQIVVGEITREEGEKIAKSVLKIYLEAVKVIRSSTKNTKKIPEEPSDEVKEFLDEIKKDLEDIS